MGDNTEWAPVFNLAPVYTKLTLGLLSVGGAQARASLQGNDALVPSGLIFLEEIAIAEGDIDGSKGCWCWDHGRAHHDKLVSRGPPPEPTTTSSKEGISEDSVFRFGKDESYKEL